MKLAMIEHRGRTRPALVTGDGYIDIGKTCRNVPAERFGEVVFGYCLGNDVSVREMAEV